MLLRLAGALDPWCGVASPRPVLALALGVRACMLASLSMYVCLPLSLGFCSRLRSRMDQVKERPRIVGLTSSPIATGGGGERMKVPIRRIDWGRIHAIYIPRTSEAPVWRTDCVTLGQTGRRIRIQRDR
eukprot:GHVU01130019.1.p2 GENE.GHVU01130019.1~~GHVU01130019.1.p2  ORF type:complete len:129 (+),score=6.58 GHVU01130019.1:526-912(+)